MGSASLVLNADGAVTAEQRYLPFGEPRLTATLPTDRLFTGQRQLASLNIFHFGARAHSPLTGRFLSADPLVPDSTNPQSLNRYAFVLGNPLRYVDPTGYDPCTGIPGTYQPDCGVDEGELPAPPLRPLTTQTLDSEELCFLLPTRCAPSNWQARSPLQARPRSRLRRTA